MLKYIEPNFEKPVGQVVVTKPQGYEINPILNADSYKTSQYLQVPKGTEQVSSYAEPRGGQYSHVVAFGMQAFVNQYLNRVPTMGEVKRASRIARLHGVPFNYKGWKALAKLGYYPVHIQALPEGSIVPVKNAVFQITNTLPEFYWLVSYLETQMLRAIWYTSTVATLSTYIRNMLNGFAKQCGVPDESLVYKFHNFGDRGASCTEAAMLAGMSHLVSWMGTDSLVCLEAVEVYYHVDFEQYAIAHSIAASEHSTITSWGKASEIEAFKNMIEKFGGWHEDGSPKVYACVSDSWNIWKALEMWKSLELDIIRKGGRLVIRPDSGCPINTPVNVVKRCLELFGYTEVKGGDGRLYKVLPDHIRVIQGDGVNAENIRTICNILLGQGISIENIAFGMGGELVQKINRDTMKWAMKCSYIAGKSYKTLDQELVVQDWEQGVYKNPVGTSHPDQIPNPDGSFKKSKSGRLAVVERFGRITTINVKDLVKGERDLLQTIFLNGNMFDQVTFETIRKRVADGCHLIKSKKN